jgi:hypothetical protein
MTRRRTCRLTCPPDLPYDPAPDLAALLRVLSWAQPIGPAWAGSSADLAGRLRRGLGLPADATTAEYEAALAAAANRRRDLDRQRRDAARS